MFYLNFYNRSPKFDTIFYLDNSSLNTFYKTKTILINLKNVHLNNKQRDQKYFSIKDTFFKLKTFYLCKKQTVIISIITYNSIICLFCLT